MNPRDDDGFRTPEEAALASMSDIPARYQRLVGVRYSEDGVSAVVEFATNEEPRLHPYYVTCRRDAMGRWFDYGSHN